MIAQRVNSSVRKALVIALASTLAACAVVPKAPEDNPPAPAPAPLPADEGRHRVALLVPLSGTHGAAGQRGDLRSEEWRGREDALAVAQTARSAQVPVISYTGDDGVAGGNVFVMGSIPAQSIARVVRYARAQSSTRFAALIPLGDYGERAGKAMIGAVRASGGQLVGMESYDRTKGTLPAAVRRLKAHGAYDAVLVADTGGVSVQAAPLLKAGPTATAVPLRILGTDLWNGEAGVARAPALAGAWFAAMSDQRSLRFANAYKARFGAQPYRIATLGYDSVLLTLRIAREWKPGTTFPISRLYDRGGFLGSDGIFRFGANNVIERALEVREVRGGATTVVSPAPGRFED